MKKLQETINEVSKIAIISHFNPDADALCSSFALKNIILNNFDLKYVDVFADGEIDELYEPILRNEVINPKPYNSYDLVILLDCPNPNRVGKYIEIYNATKKSINIDHHNTNEKFASEINYVSEKVSSTCEFLFLLAKTCNFDLNNLIAKELYQGIITDTNCFTSLTLSKNTHLVLNELLKYKFDSDKIKEYYFKNMSKAKAKLIAKSLNGIKYYGKNKSFALMKISYNDLVENGAHFEDTLGIIDTGASISGVKVCGIIIEQEPNRFYVSLRSKGEINAGEIAKVFNGGGSEKIAAFQFKGEIEDLKTRFLTTLNEQTKKANIDTDEDSVKLF